MNVSDFTIYVCYDPAANPPFTYTDENHHPAQSKSGCHAGKKIKWVLQKGCAGSNLQIYFPSGNPFNPPQANPQAGKDYKFNNLHDTSYKYEVSVTYNGQTITDDPRIIFDDGKSAADIRLFGDSLASLGTAAQTAF
jgi:hypothetical protein